MHRIKTEKFNCFDRFFFLVNVEMAILLYKQGIQELDKAVRLPVDPNSKNIDRF